MMENVECHYFCGQENCNKAFKRKDRLEVHLRTHTGERPFTCPVPGCSNTYARSQHLSRHLQKAHILDNEPKSRVKCSQCNKDFANQETLKGHEKRFHTMPDNPKTYYQCQEEGCDKVFHKRQQLVAHREKDHAHNVTVAERCLKCPHEGCGKTFRFHGIMKKHMKIHQGYKCDIEGCTEVLPTWTGLRKHKAIDHANLVCSICQCSFKTKQILAQHVKTHSSIKELFPCPREGCERTFLYKKNMRQHIRAFHEGKQVFHKKQKPPSEKAKRRTAFRKKSSAARLCGLDDRSITSVSQETKARNEDTGLVLMDDKDATSLNTDYLPTSPSAMNITVSSENANAPASLDVNVPISHEAMDVTAIHEDMIIQTSNENTEVSDLNKDMLIPVSNENAKVLDLNKEMIVSVSNENANVSDLNKEMIVPVSNENAKVLDLNEDMIVPVSNEKANVSDLNKETIVPVSNENAKVLDLNEDMIVTAANKDVQFEALNADLMLKTSNQDKSALASNTGLSSIEKEDTIFPNISNSVTENECLFRDTQAMSV